MTRNVRLSNLFPEVRHLRRDATPDLLYNRVLSSRGYKNSVQDTLCTYMPRSAMPAKLRSIGVSFTLQAILVGFSFILLFARSCRSFSIIDTPTTATTTRRRTLSTGGEVMSPSTSHSNVRRSKRLRRSAVAGTTLSNDSSKFKRMTELRNAAGSSDASIVTSTWSSRLLTRIGVLADIQYAPIPDGYSFSGNPRYYRHALDVARHAAQHFQQEKVDLVVNLGDIVDGKCQSIAVNGGIPLPETDPQGRSVGEQCVDHVMDALSCYSHGPMLHSYGNHCLYNLDRTMLQTKLKIPFVQEPCGDLVGYHSYVVGSSGHGGVRFVVLDTYDIAIMQRCDKQSKKRQEAVEILKNKNPNFPQLQNSPEGLNGMAKRFVAFNGGVGPLQLEWLRRTLDEARAMQQTVIVLSHTNFTGFYQPCMFGLELQ